MRPLICILLSVATGIPLSAMAASPRISLEHQQTRGGSLLTAGGGGGVQQIEVSSQSIRIDLALPSGRQTLGVQLSQNAPDYSNFLIRSDTGVEIPLSSRTGRTIEYSLLLKGTHSWGDHTLSGSLLNTLSSSPFAANAIGLGWERSWNASAYRFGAVGQAMKQRQPSSTYLGRDQKQRRRPEQVHGYQGSLYFDHVINERSRNRIELGTGQRIEERPMNFWIRDRFGYALHDRVFARLEGRHGRELESDLKNERGHFSIWHGIVSLTVEPLYGLLMTPSYGLLLEHEDDPRTGTLSQIATDQFGLSLEYSLRSARISSSLTRELSNTDAHATLLSAGVTWTL